MDYQKNYELWKTDSFFDADTRQELEAITDAKEIEERFYKISSLVREACAVLWEPEQTV